MEQSSSIRTKVKTDAHIYGTKQSNKIDELSTTRMELNIQSVGNKMEADTIIRNGNHSAVIFKLTIDCFEKVFDYLSFWDLIALSETCGQLKQVAAYNLGRNYQSLQYLTIKNLNPIQSGYIHLTEFANELHFDSDHEFQYFLDIQPRLRRVTKILFHNFTFTLPKIECMKKTLRTVEYLTISDSVFNGTIHDSMLVHCPNLVQLRIQNINTGTEWMKQRFPKLKHFEWMLPNADGLVTFLALNPNIRIFTISEECLWENQHSMIASNVSIDILEIDVFDTKFKCEFHYISYNILLNKLQKRGFCKLLQVNYYETPTQEALTLLSLLDAPLTLRLFFSENFSKRFLLSDLENLEELHIGDSFQIEDMETCANSLTNLKRIGFCEASFDHIVPLISRATNLKTVYIIAHKTGNYYDESKKIINLPALNKMREKLKDATKIMLYVEEAAYLATKWAHKTTDFGLIKIRRNSSLRWC